MRYAAAMTFDIEADSDDEAMSRLKDLQSKITTASQRLGIGYRQGTVVANAQPGWSDKPVSTIDCTDPATLFDDPPHAES
jgi:hypothetical protein